MKITVTVETEGRVGTQTVVTNTADVGVGGPHEYESAIRREAGRLGFLATEQLMLAVKSDAARNLR